MPKSYLSLIGFLIFFIGLLGIILSIVGLKLSFLSFVDAPSRTFGLIVKLLLIFVGMIVLYISKTGSRVD